MVDMNESQFSMDSEFLRRLRGEGASDELVRKAVNQDPEYVRELKRRLAPRARVTLSTLEPMLVEVGSGVGAVVNEPVNDLSCVPHAVEKPQREYKFRDYTWIVGIVGMYDLSNQRLVDVVRVGRRTKADLSAIGYDCMPDMTVSREHGLVILSGGDMLYVDYGTQIAQGDGSREPGRNGSRNGTYFMNQDNLRITNQVVDWPQTFTLNFGLPVQTVDGRKRMFQLTYEMFDPAGQGDRNLVHDPVGGRE